MIRKQESCVLSCRHVSCHLQLLHAVCENKPVDLLTPITPSNGLKPPRGAFVPERLL